MSATWDYQSVATTGPLRAGYVLGRGRQAEYLLVSELGSRGGEGTVWEAEFLGAHAPALPHGLTPGDHVALKILNDEHRAQLDDFEDRWSRFAEFYNKREPHPNLVRVWDRPFRGKLPHHPDDYFESGAATLYLSMELLIGSSLRELVELRPANSVRRSHVRALQGVADGLTALASVTGSVGAASGSLLSKRSGLVHRDVKPDNIIFPAGRAPVLIDFGSVREMFTSRVYTSYGGTMGYTAPEASDDTVAWELQLTPAADLYSFACVVYYTLSGHHPPQQQSRWKSHLASRVSWVGEPAREILAQVLLEEDPSIRLKIDTAEWCRRLIAALFAHDSSPLALSAAQAIVPQISRDDTSTKNGQSAGAESESELEVAETLAHLESDPDTRDRRDGSSAAGAASRVGGIGHSEAPIRSRYAPELAAASQFVYLKEHGKIALFPKMPGELGAVTNGIRDSSFVVERRHINDNSLELGAKVNYRLSDRGSALDVFPSRVTRIRNGKSAPFEEGGLLAAIGFGPFLASGCYIAARLLWTPDDWHTGVEAAGAVGVAILTFFLVLISVMFREDEEPKFEERTLWEGKHYSRVQGAAAFLYAAAIGLAMGSGNSSYVRDVAVSLSIGSDGVRWWGQVLSVAIVLMIAILLGTLVMDVIFRRYLRLAKLPMRDQDHAVFVAFKVCGIVGSLALIVSSVV